MGILTALGLGLWLLSLPGHTSQEEADRISEEYLGTPGSPDPNIVDWLNREPDDSFIFTGKYLIYSSIVYGFWKGLNSK